MLEATRDTVQLTSKMAEAGADAALIITPSFYKNAMNNEALYQHFHKVFNSIITESTSLLFLFLYLVIGAPCCSAAPCR